MAIFEFNDSLLVLAGKPLDDKFGPYTSVSAANIAIPQARRYAGLIFGVYTNPSDLPNSDIDYYYYYGDFSDTEVKKLLTITLQEITDNGNTTTTTIVHADAVNNNESATLGQVITLINNATGGVTGDFVPYTGATKTVELGDQGIEVDYIDFSLTPSSTIQKGRLIWSESNGSLRLGLKTNVNTNIGLDKYVLVKNQTGSTISKGRVVRIIGSSSTDEKLLISPSVGFGEGKNILGIASENISNTQTGYIITSGYVSGINTTGSLYGESWVNGDYLYVSSSVSGGLTKNKPNGPNMKTPIAIVVKTDSSNGVLFIKPITSINLDDINNTFIPQNTLVNKDILTYNTSTTNWENKTLAFILGGSDTQFVKGDGTLDSTEYQELITGAATTITDNDLNTNLVVVSDSNGKISTTGITTTELIALSGVTGNIQDQLDEALIKPVIGDIIKNEEFIFVSGDTFTLSETADSINSVYVNGQYIPDSYYSLSGDTVTFTNDIIFETDPEPDQINIKYIKEMT